MATSPPKKKQRKEANPLPWVMLVVVLICGSIWFVSRSSSITHKATVEKEMSVVILPPPPSPPPPKVEPPPPKEETPAEEEEMLVQDPVQNDEPEPDNAPEPAPGPDLGPGSAGGTGPSIGGGGGGNGKIGSRRTSSSKFGWYAAKIQSAITAALRGNSATRSATMSLQVRIWPDSNGRITRAQLVGTSGDAAVDQAIKNQILTGLQLPQAPPADMPTPIVLRINARKPVL